MNPENVTMPETRQLPAEWIARCPRLTFTAGHYRKDGSCRCTPRLAVERNVEKEARAVEEGHRAFVQPGGTVRVKSDTHEGKWYVITPIDSGFGIVFRCTPEGAHAFEDDHLATSSTPGVLPCKHAALAARRLEREGLARVIDGLWFTTTQPHRHTFVNGRCTGERCGVPENPFEGLPR